MPGAVVITGDERVGEALDGPAPVRRRWSPVDLAFAVVVLATVRWYLQLTAGNFFQWDDWRLAVRPAAGLDLVEPWNGHLSVVPLLVYRGLYAAVGLGSYLPFRIIGIGSLIALVVAVHLVARHRLGPLPALVMAAAVLWMPNMSLQPVLFNFHLALLCGVVCAAVMPSRSGRADVVIAAALVLALGTSSVGVAVVAVCVVHAVFSGFRPGRWTATMVPGAAWIAWWLLHAGGGRTTHDGWLDRASTLVRGSARSFGAPVLWSPVLAFVLFAACGALLVWRLGRDHASARTQIAWTAGLIVWWAGLALARAGAADNLGNVYRYAYVGAVFVLLSLLPARPLRWPAALTSHRLRWAGPALAAVASLVLLIANADGIGSTVTGRHRFGNHARVALVELEHAPSPPAPSTKVPEWMGSVTVGQVVAVVARLDPSPQISGDPDEILVRYRGVVANPSRGADRCRGGTTATLPVGSSLIVQARDRPVTVFVRRYGRTGVPLRTVGAGGQVTVTTGKDALDTTTPWSVEVPGGCVAGG